jgi:large subunit ribosomal protein L21
LIFSDFFAARRRFSARKRRRRFFCIRRGFLRYNARRRFFLRRFGYTMRAVFISGGKQYRVRVGDIVAVEKLAAEAGAQVDFDEVLLLEKGGANAAVGEPLIGGAKVRATVIAQERGPKLRIFKLRRRKNSRRSGGHRQYATRVKVDEIVAPDGAQAEEENKNGA